MMKLKVRGGEVYFYSDSGALLSRYGNRDSARRSLCEDRIRYQAGIDMRREMIQGVDEALALLDAHNARRSRQNDQEGTPAVET